MNFLSFDTFLNSSVVDTVSVYWECFLTFLTDKTTDINDKDLLNILAESLYFNDFQRKLFTSFLAFLVVNLVFIFITWKIYGKRICSRFMKPATSKAIEDLKASVSRLKLPKEHSPRV